MSGLKTRLMAPELVKEFADIFISEVNSLRKTAASHRDRLDAELVATKKRIRTVVTAITDGEPPKTLVEELRRLEEVQARLEQEISAEPHEPQPLIHPNMSEIYRRRVENLHNLLIDPASKDEASEIIRSLIDRIVLSPMNGELQIDLHGELAAILNFCQDSKKPAADSIKDISGFDHLELPAGDDGGATYSHCSPVLQGDAPIGDAINVYFNGSTVLADTTPNLDVGSDLYFVG